MQDEGRHEELGGGSLQKLKLTSEKNTNMFGTIFWALSIFVMYYE